MRIEDLPDAHLRIFNRPAPPPPQDIQSVYLIGICGTGMGSVATLLQEAGYSVSGSDEHVYPPMSTRLSDAGIPVHHGFDESHLHPPPDLTIVGNACTPQHVEAAYARNEGLVQQSFPEALGHFFLSNRHPYVVAGTHGKTTTTALLTHVLIEAGMNPGFLVGGVLQSLQTTSRVGTGKPFVIEGDEYDCAYFDKQPKFVHYQPHVAIVTSMELDHTDIYPDWESYQEAFVTLARLVDPKGQLILCGDHQAVRALASHAKADVTFYGLDDGELDVTASEVSVEPNGQSFKLTIRGNAYGRVMLPLHGRHNLSNTLAAIAAALQAGVSIEGIRRGLATFEGIKRRQEVRGIVNDVMVIDDFAHHPTAVRETVQAMRNAHPDRRLVAVFEPRSNSSRRKTFEQEYPIAFEGANVVYLATPLFRHNDKTDDVLDACVVAEHIRQTGIEAQTLPDADAVLDALLENTRPGDAILIMSNGGFDRIHERLLEELGT